VMESFGTEVQTSSASDELLHKPDISGNHSTVTAPKCLLQQLIHQSMKVRTLGTGAVTSMWPLGDKEHPVDRLLGLSLLWANRCLSLGGFDR
jgi:hypothetical protein